MLNFGPSKPGVKGGLGAAPPPTGSAPEPGVIALKNKHHNVTDQKNT